MTFRTHLAIGALGAMGFVSVIDLSKADMMLATGLILLGSVLPDIDEPRSFISRKFPLISRLTAIFFEHKEQNRYKKKMRRPSMLKKDRC